MKKHIQQLYNPILFYVKARVQNQEDAEDLTQEVFYKISKTAIDEIDNIKNWAFKIAKNTITDYYRKKKIKTELFPDDRSFVNHNKNEVVLELSDYIPICINLLPDEYKSILILSDIENVPQKEIAERLGMNYITVRSKIQRGRKKLKQMFSECCGVKQGGKGSIIEYCSSTDRSIQSSLFFR